MTEKYYTSKNYKPDRTKFGGIISNYDFDGHPTLMDIAQSIGNDEKIDIQCKRNMEYRDRKTRYNRERNEKNE